MPLWVYEEGRRADPRNRFWLTATFPHPVDDWPKPSAHIEGEWVQGDDSDRATIDEHDFDDHDDAPQTTTTGDSSTTKLGGRVYGDGSCQPNDIRGLERAAVAILESDGDGRLKRAFHVPLPRLFPQTSQASEYVMLAQARRLLGRSATIFSDCLNVVRAAKSPMRLALSPSKLYAGINVEKWQMVDNDKLVEQVLWIKAHRTLIGNENAEDTRNVRGNAEADRLAKAAISAHPQPTASQRANLDFYVRRAPHVARAVATALATFPPSESARMTRVSAPRSPEEAERRQVHWWRYKEHAWRCRICGTWATCEHLSRRHHAERCHGPKAERDAKTWVERGHRIVMAKGAMSIAFCSKCGAWGKSPRPQTESRLRRTHSRGHGGAQKHHSWSQPLAKVTPARRQRASLPPRNRGHMCQGLRRLGAHRRCNRTRGYRRRRRPRSRLEYHPRRRPCHRGMRQSRE